MIEIWGDFRLCQQWRVFLCVAACDELGYGVVSDSVHSGEADSV